MARSRRTLALLALVAVVVAAFVAADASTAAKKKVPVVQLRKTSLGKILVDSKGRTLYSFGADAHGVSNCSGPCATNWPPARASKLSVGKGLTRNKLRLFKRADGTFQLEYARHPLYRFIADKKPGDVSGQGINAFGGMWYVLNAKGSVVTSSAGSGSTQSGPYGY
jgi:predicted lipoprotein with Yx(FWY)xxD motif